MFKVLILICSVSINPANCGRDNATDVVTAEPQQGAAMCGMMGQIVAADAFGYATDKYYVKVQCPRIMPLTPVG